MKLGSLLQLSFIISFLMIGHGFVALFHLPLSGSIVGMLLLFIFLMTGTMKLEWIDKVSSFQVKHLTVLFIPSIAGLFTSSDLMAVFQWDILIILIVSSICCLLGTASAVQWYEQRRDLN
ncbi:holin-like protein [Lentibacillus halodurans]|uniref:Holin-like protein n=1 Tax=Lentibacillus halodurans TaxID=237679 RepID=A0A1I0WLP4_9BACI|nr:CidA/LrgA family protein [Lentibacillus halodurans]SFA89474.1 holin-like protein [Lentibacillus halodurans]